MAIDLNTLQNYYSKNFDNAQQAQKSFSDMLRERSQFVQGAENGVGDQASNFIKNGSNGVLISPAATLDPVMNFHTDNANKTAQLTQQMFGFGNQSNDALKGLLDTLSMANSQGIAGEELKLKQSANDRENYLAGMGSNGTGSNNLVESTVDSILNGTMEADKALATLPKGLQPQVLTMLKEKGYDPGAPDAKTRANVEGVITMLNDLKKDAKKVGVMDLLSASLPDSKLSQFDRKKGIVAQAVARMYEKGTLSDSDRKFYKTIIGISPFGFDKGKDENIDSLIDDLKVQSGYNKYEKMSGKNLEGGSSKTTNTKQTDSLGIL